MKIEIEIDRETALKLAALAPPTRKTSALRSKVVNVLNILIDHAQQGVYRPGAWERGWVCQAFGDEWLENVVPDTSRLRADGVPIFDRPNID